MTLNKLPSSHFEHSLKLRVTYIHLTLNSTISPNSGSVVSARYDFFSLICTEIKDQRSILILTFCLPNLTTIYGSAMPDRRGVTSSFASTTYTRTCNQQYLQVRFICFLDFTCMIFSLTHHTLDWSGEFNARRVLDQTCSIHVTMAVLDKDQTLAVITCGNFFKPNKNPY